MMPNFFLSQFFFFNFCCHSGCVHEFEDVARTAVVSRRTLKHKRANNEIPAIDYIGLYIYIIFFGAQTGHFSRKGGSALSGLQANA
jgi:hypothetical protein